MIEFILESLSHFVLNVIESSGYFGIFLLMAVESANIPFPSEVIMSFAGFLVSKGTLSFWPVVFFGALGNLFGSLISYSIAFWGSKKALKFLIKWRLLNKNDLTLSINIFKKYGKTTAFFSRLLPIVRTFISFPAGLFKSNILSFSILTFAGSFFWSAVLTYLGVKAGDNWQSLEVYFHKFDFVIAILIIIGIIMVFKHHFSGDKIEDIENDENYNF